MISTGIGTPNNHNMPYFTERLHCNTSPDRGGSPWAPCPSVCATGFVPIVVLDRRQRLVTRPLGSADIIDGAVQVTDDRVHTLLERRPFRVADVCARTRSFAERNVFPILARSPLPEVGAKASTATPAATAQRARRRWMRSYCSPVGTETRARRRGRSS